MVHLGDSEHPSPVTIPGTPLYRDPSPSAQHEHGQPAKQQPQVEGRHIFQALGWHLG
jgi:hypothetical protein